MKEEPSIPEIWPQKAYKNLDFLTSPAARTIRVNCEFTEPRVRFEKYDINHTIVFFGSARPLPPEAAKSNLDELERQLEPRMANLSAEEERNLEKARSAVKLSPYYEKARQLSCRLTEWSKSIPDKSRRFHMCSGGGPGIMEAANRGALEAGGLSIGLGISLPFEQTNNDFITPELSFEFHYFFVRKYWFLYPAKAIVVFPGGFGTMDELFEMLTLAQTRKIHKELVVILFGKDFWDSFLDFEALIDWGTISRRDMELLQIADTVDEAFELTTRTLSERFLL